MIQDAAQRLADEARDVGELLKSLTRDSRTLLRQEVELAKTEFSEKATRIGRHAGLLAGGVLLAYAGLLALIFAAVMGLAHVLDGAVSTRTSWWLASLIVGAIVAGVGGALAYVAINRLRSESVAHTKTLKTLREDQQWLKERMT